MHLDFNQSLQIIPDSTASFTPDEPVAFCLFSEVAQFAWRFLSASAPHRHRKPCASALFFNRSQTALPKTGFPAPESNPCSPCSTSAAHRRKGRRLVEPSQRREQRATFAFVIEVRTRLLLTVRGRFQTDAFRPLPICGKRLRCSLRSLTGRNNRR